MDNVDYKIITGIRYDNLSDNLNILNRNSIEPISSLDNDIARKLEMDNTIDTSDIEFNINEKFKDGWTFYTIDSLIVNHIKKNNKLGFLHYSMMMYKPKDAYKNEAGIWLGRPGVYSRYMSVKECKILTNMKSNELTDKINDYTNNGWGICGNLLVEKAVHNNNEYLYFTQMLVKGYKY